MRRFMITIMKIMTMIMNEHRMPDVQTYTAAMWLCEMLLTRREIFDHRSNVTDTRETV